MALFKPRLLKYVMNLTKFMKEERNNERWVRKGQRQNERTKQRKREINNKTNKMEVKEESGEEK
jgi:hypothetical protein